MPLADKDAGARAAAERHSENCRRMLGSLGMELIPVRSNISDLEWIDRRTVRMAEVGLLSLFANRFATAVIANQVPYTASTTEPGSTPATDVLLGSRAFQVVDDGGECEQRAKIAAVADWHEGLPFLHFCSARHPGYGNCGECQDCLQAIMVLRSRELELPPCFDRNLSLDAVRRLRIEDSAMLRVYEDLSRGLPGQVLAGEPWARLLRRKLRRARARLAVRHAVGISMALFGYTGLIEE